MSLLDEISKLTTPASALPDLEDDDYDGTSARKLASSRPKAKFVESNFEEGKYAGKKVSRKDLFGDMSEMSGISNQKDLDSDDSDNEDEEEADDEEENESGKSDEEVSENDEIEKSDDDQGSEDDEVDDEVDDDADDEEEDEENTGISKITLANESLTSSNKAECIQNQRKVWDDIMYTNIRMHALLNASNQLPRGDARKKMIQSADEKTKENMAKTLKNMGKLRQLLKETCGLFNEKVVDDDDDEEIPSDEDIGDLNSEGEDDDEDGEDVNDEDEEEDSDDDTKTTKAAEQGVSAESLSKFLKHHDEEFDKFRATTITKWYNRTKLLNSKSANSADFSVFEKGSVLSQISKILSDESKFVKKIRTNRSGKIRMGVVEEQDGIDDEIFDDSDFYQILLKQMIESRSNNVNTTENGVDMTRSYMELQKMFNNKKKRDVTSLSSKDRRLKYEPIAKLINFFPARPSVVTWSHESRNELFKSLFS